MDKWHFNEKFLKDKIAEGKLVLKKFDKDTNIYKDAKMMVEQFEFLLGKDSKKSFKSINESFESQLNNLNRVLNKSLNLIQLYEWKSLKNLCQNVPQYNFERINSNLLPKNNKYAINASLEMFKKIDFSIYEATFSIVNNKTQLINLLNSKSNNDNCCVLCEYLKLPFVYVSAQDDWKYIVLSHELRHAADYYLYKVHNSNLTEVSSIYSEMIMCDEINKFYECPNIYNSRINLFSGQIKKIIPYIEMLIRFDNCERELTLHNYEKILNISSEKDFKNKYSLLIDEKHITLYDYIISTLCAISFREEYYKGNKEVINKKMKHLLLGSNYKLNYDNLQNKYVNYVKEVKKLSKK